MQTKSLLVTAENITARLRPAPLVILRLLRQTRPVADAASGDSYSSPVEWKTLLAAGGDEDSLRQLLEQGLVEHYIMTKLTGAKRPQFRKASSQSFSERSCFTLTKKGLAAAVAAESTAASPRPIGNVDDSRRIYIPKPIWKPEPLRQLWAGDVLLHQFRRPAPNLIRILEAFQELNWVECMDDPIPPVNHKDSKKRLDNAVQRLNRCQRPQLLYFSVLNDGTAVAWRWLAVPEAFTRDAD